LQETLWEMFHTFSTHRISMTVVFSPWHLWRQTNLADSRSKIWQLAEPTGQPTVKYVKYVKGVEPGCEMHLGWVNPQAWIWDGSFNSTFAIIFNWSPPECPTHIGYRWSTWDVATISND
jgi:hypothetical protein